MHTIQSLIYEAKNWCQGRNWWIRLPLLLFFVYVLYRHLADPNYKSIIGALNLGIHELGHVIFSFFGMFICALGGSLAQCTAPVIGMYNFYLQKDFFAIAISFGWLSTNLFEVATYVGDAKAQELPLVGLGFGPPMHDWNYLLKTMHLLQYSSQISSLLRLAAVLSMVICIMLGAWLLWQMKISKPKESSSPAHLE